MDSRLEKRIDKLLDKMDTMIQNGIKAALLVQKIDQINHEDLIIRTILCRCTETDASSMKWICFFDLTNLIYTIVRLCCTYLIHFSTWLGFFIRYSKKLLGYTQNAGINK